MVQTPKIRNPLDNLKDIIMTYLDKKFKLLDILSIN